MADVLGAIKGALGGSSTPPGVPTTLGYTETWHQGLKPIVGYSVPNQSWGDYYHQNLSPGAIAHQLNPTTREGLVNIAGLAAGTGFLGFKGGLGKGPLPPEFKDPAGFAQANIARTAFNRMMGKAYRGQLQYDPVKDLSGYQGLPAEVFKLGNQPVEKLGYTSGSPSDDLAFALMDRLMPQGRMIGSPSAYLGKTPGMEVPHMGSMNAAAMAVNPEMMRQFLLEYLRTAHN